MTAWLGYGLDGRGSIPARGKKGFFFGGGGFHLDSYQMDPGVLSPALKLTAHLPLVPKLRTRGAAPPVRRTFSWRDIWLSRGTALPFTCVLEVVIIFLS